MSGPASSAAPLLALARSRRPADRERLIQALAAFCDLPEAGATARAQGLINDVFMVLIADAERDIRLRLADSLAEARWAPSALVNTLALDDIEIARPLIARSPVLSDPDLIQLLVMATLEHQIEVARRPELASAVVRAILDKGEPVVLTALAGNESARIDAEGMAELVTASRHIASLRAPLARHPRLNARLAHTLFAWVGEALRQEIGARFVIDPAALEAAVDAAVGRAYAGRDAIPTGAVDRQEMETRLIAKLQAAGQLRPGFLLKSLREGKLYLFELALAALAHLRTDTVRDACASDRPERVALLCAGVGIDRSVFPTLLSLLRALNNGRPSATPDSLRNINAAFTHASPEAALDAFRAMMDHAPAQDAPDRRSQF